MHRFSKKQSPGSVEKHVENVDNFMEKPWFHPQAVDNPVDNCGKHVYKREKPVQISEKTVESEKHCPPESGCGTGMASLQ